MLSGIDVSGHKHSDFVNFYEDNGDLQLELLNKLILEAIQNNKFDGLSDVQKAFTGHGMMKLLQRRVLDEKMFRSK